MSRPVSRIGDSTNEGKPVKIGSSNVFSNGIPVARVGDTVGCEDSGDRPIISGSPNVFVNGIPVSGVGDSTGCPSTLVEGSSNVFIS